MAAAKAMLDEVHASLPARKFDDNTYILGRMCSHNIVITCLPAGIYGAVSAATVATRMLSTFQSIRFGLVVGIGGGVPGEADIRLGDVVVGQPTKRSGGVLRCDVDFEHTSTLNKPSYLLLNALSNLQANHLVHGNEITKLLSEMLKKYPLMRHKIMPDEQDRLFRADYEHSSPLGSCSDCDKRHLVTRALRDTAPQIHYGLIASVTKVVRDGATRDRLARKLKNLCFEMEAAGLMDNFPCLVIRGISDYADSHKNDHWQGYAAATAAAYAKELLSVIPSEDVESEQRVSQLYQI
jgi:nucleoside phosphorylase